MDRNFALVREEVHNETLALMEFLSGGHRVVYIVWSVLRGTRRNPGVGIMLALLPTQRQAILEAFAASLAGRARGVQSWLAGRGDSLTEDT
jgi:cation transport regulator ChaC